ncbi:hypothetical protein LINPERPRIM_LOCUS1525 [Linum perenne]
MDHHHAEIVGNFKALSGRVWNVRIKHIEGEGNQLEAT